ncbi:DUF3159 domain-containing protein [Rarobacter incanus]|uniref:Uncharacterized protein DUF3159 n=1 Tax=Rarobacter incanus TaxID=153494 RepID=A0A542SLR2_9MICO|nr:DUF3159 domain-containing protein [Rarobacter incanus]TQK75569.1 uncharacterized protein DUF3159 [Rarobacter incanus]
MANESGIKSLTADEFDPLAAVGGIRGLIESMLPGTLFVIVFVLTNELRPPIIAAGAAALLAVVVRLAQRSSLTQALSGVAGIAIGVIWAWRSGKAENYYLWGLLTNAGYLAVILISIMARWPAVGVVVELFKAGFHDAKRIESGQTKGWSKWRGDPLALKEYNLASWLWVALFGARLVVQLPLYLTEQVGWLGTARLVMGLPLWAATLWLTWIVINGRAKDRPVPTQEPA